MISIKPSSQIHIYTGDGKGKTTAAFGLALRAAGAGFNVRIYQFIKGPKFCERAIFRGMTNVSVTHFGNDRFIKGKPTSKDVARARGGICRVIKDIKAHKPDMVILDEVNVALDLGLLSVSDILSVMNYKSCSIDIVLTGRSCPKALYKYADLVTEMRKIKHPFDSGEKARCGVDF